MSDAQRLCDAIRTGELGRSDLTARRLGAFLGATTSRVYHNFGSLDGLLYAVSQQGFAELGPVLFEADARGGMPEVAAAFVRFGLDHPVLYELMFEWPYDWASLPCGEGNSPGLQMWTAMQAALADRGSADPVADARILYASLHGLVSLARTGRANIGDLSWSDREVADLVARSIPQRLLGHES